MIASGLEPEDASIHRDQQRMLEGLLAQLPEDFREVLILRDIEDMDYREIAAVTNVPLGTVMSRLARARSALRKRWFLQSEGTPRAVP